MLETGVCKWRHITLGFEATAHRSAVELASTLRKLRVLWFEVGRSFQAECFLGKKAEKKSRSELLSKTALLSMLGAWGRTENFRHHMITTSHDEDLTWAGEVSSKPTPESERTDTGYIFHDISWKQKVKTLATFLPLNLIGRNQERLQVARALSLAHLCSCRILSIQVDGIYMQFPKKGGKEIRK
jgi:hypothetical protein